MLNKETTKRYLALQLFHRSLGSTPLHRRQESETRHPVPGICNRGSLKPQPHFNLAALRPTSMAGVSVFDSTRHPFCGSMHHHHVLGLTARPCRGLCSGTKRLSTSSEGRGPYHPCRHAIDIAEDHIDPGRRAALSLVRTIWFRLFHLAEGAYKVTSGCT